MRALCRARAHRVIPGDNYLDIVRLRVRSSASASHRPRVSPEVAIRSDWAVSPEARLFADNEGGPRNAGSEAVEGGRSRCAPGVAH